jgi:peptide/nickel transport system substrate-binding protein
LPLHLLGNVSAASLFDHPFNQQPIGDGPYRLEQLTNDGAVLDAYPAHHLGQPFVQRLELRFYRDEGALLAALRTRQVDGALFSGGINPNDYLRLQQRDDLRLSLLPTAETTLIYLNLRLPVFQELRVRQALLTSLDREAIVTDVFGGQALAAGSIIVPGSWAYSDALGRYDPNPEVAAALLSEAGWNPNARGIRAKGGQELTFTLVVNNDPVRVAVANIVAERWRGLGVAVTIETIGTTTLVRDYLTTRDFDAALFAHVEDADPDPYPAWHSTQTGPNRANLASFADSRVDRILEEARLLAPPPRRSQLYYEFQELFAQELPSLPLYVSTALYVQDASLQGVRVTSLASPAARFWQVQDWYLKTR